MDGINRHILTVATALNKQECLEVAVCTVFPRGELNTALESEGVRTFTLNAPNGHDWHIIPRFSKVMKEYKPDVIHNHVMAIAERLVLSSCYRRKKYVVTIHGISDKVEHLTMRMKLEKMIANIFPIKYNASCFISNGVKEALDERASGKSIVCYNPLHFGEVPSRTYALHNIIGVSHDTPIIGTSCRIAGVKQPQKFTEVMCRVLKKVPEVHAVVMGDGVKPLIDASKEIVKQYGVEDRFHWLGYRNDAPQLVKDLSCFVMTSISEGMPTSILESMTLKTPFAFLEGNGGLKDIAQLNQSEGPMAVQAAKDDLEGLATGIINLLNNELLANEYAERAYKVGKIHFDIQSVVNQLTELYKQL